MHHGKYGIAAAAVFLISFVCQAADPVAGPTLAPAPSTLPVQLPSQEPVFVYPPPPAANSAPVVPKVLRTPETIYVYPTVPNDRNFRKANGLRIPTPGPVHLWWDYVRSPQHQGEPDGTYKPIGGASFWTEFKFAYGSTRQFFGSAEAPPVHRQFFNPELPPGYMLRAWHPNRNGRVE